MFSKWQAGEPNNYGNEDCLQGNRYPNGFWNDISCESSSSVICYKETLTGNAYVHHYLINMKGNFF